MALLDWESPLLDHLNLVAGDETRAEALIASVSAAIEKYCNRGLERTERTEYHTLRTGQVFCRAYPIDHVARICSSSVDALTITGTGEVATFAVTATGLTLNRIASGTRTTTTLTFASNTTLTALATAIAAVTGWSATVASGYGNYPSADLIEGQSGNAKTTAPVGLWVDDTTPAYDIDTRTGVITLGHLGRNAWLADYRGCNVNRVRITYTGGYATVPADLQQACADLVGLKWNNKAGAIQSESLGEYSYSISTADLNACPLNTRKTLDAYRDRVL